MKDTINLWRLMRLPMAQWWEGVGKWLILPISLLVLAAALKFMLMPNMPLQKWVISSGVISRSLLSELQVAMQIPIMLLLYAFIGLWVCAAIACQRRMKQLLEESAAPLFDASPLTTLIVCYSQGLILLPISLIVYTGLGFLHAMADRMQPQFYPSILQFSSSLGNSTVNAFRPQDYVQLLESVSQFSASAFAIAAISLWICAVAVAAGTTLAAGFLALLSLDVSLLSVNLLFGSRALFSGRPLIREAIPFGEFWLCIPFLLIVVSLLASGDLIRRRIGTSLLAMFAISPSLFCSILPNSQFIEDTWGARLLNSLHYMSYGIGGPVFQVQADIISTGSRMRFVEHLLLYGDRVVPVFSASGNGIMLAWIGNLLVLAVLFILVAATICYGMPRHSAGISGHTRRSHQ